MVFLAINTDEDTSAVQPFLESNKWATNTVYFEDGLSNLLKVGSIPTTIIFDKQGQLFSRMNGFVPERFVDQLYRAHRRGARAMRRFPSRHLDRA